MLTGTKRDLCTDDLSRDLMSVSQAAVDYGSIWFIVVLCTVGNADVSAALNTSFKTQYLSQDGQFLAFKHLHSVIQGLKYCNGLNFDWL